MSMLERLARAICVMTPGARRWADLSTHEKFAYRVTAAGALEAIREPSPALIALIAVKSDVTDARCFEIAGEAVSLLPRNTDPDVPDVLAGLAQDWSGMIDAIREGRA